MRFVTTALTLVACGAAVVPCQAQVTGGDRPAPRLTLDETAIRRAIESATTAEDGDRTSAQSQANTWAKEGRACEACPRRRPANAYLQATIVNVFYNAGNRFRGEETAKVGPHSWWANMKYGFEWDDNPFTTNQFGHPYQGNNYYTAGRANGLSYWESGLLAAFGSATWEYFGENNYASFNDLVNTTLGGIALGEMFHRTGWLIRDTRVSGKKRLWGEIAAMAADPLTGVNRFISGDASRVSERPAALSPSTGDAVGSAGLLWQGTSANKLATSPKFFLEMDLKYGTITSGRSREPFEAFTVNFRLGGGRGISDVRVRGRLLGQPLGSRGSVQLTLAQSYDYVVNQAFDFGRQGFDLILSGKRPLASRFDLALVGGAGVTALGAVNQPPLPTLIPDADGGVGRDYDYGPGTTFGAGAQILLDGRQFANLSYQGYQLYVVDGLRSNHVMQRVRVDLLVPLRGRFGVGATGEFFYRKTYFQAGGERRDKFPQARVYLAWR